jgi:hypothetical protein
MRGIHRMGWGVLGAAALAACSPGSGAKGGTGGMGPNQNAQGGLGTPLIALGQQMSAAGECSAATAARAPIRRISRIEYNNAVLDLFGVTTQPANGFVPEEKTGVTIGFNTNIVSAVSELAVEQYVVAAEQIADGIVQSVSSVTGCTSTSDASCITNFLTTRARRAFRGTLPNDEKAQLVADYNAAVQALGADQGLRFGIEAILLSPRFLYTVEFGSGTGDVVPLTASEVAGRLAASIWRSVPSDGLIAAADKGELNTAEGVMVIAKAMLDDTKYTHAAEMMKDFASQWLDVDQTPTLTRDSMSFPAWNATVAADLLTETESFFLSIADDPAAGGFPSLLTANYTMVNANLASFYKLPAPSGSGFQKVMLPAYRSGVLTQGSVITSHSHFNRSSIVLRGKMVRFELLCDPVRPPPPTVNTTLAPLATGTTERDLASVHGSIGFCNNCHKMMDPIGYGFGFFDAVGEYTPNDGETDITGTINPPALASIDDVSGPFKDPIELSQKIAKSKDAQQCYVIQAMRYTMGRIEADGDACSAANAWSKFQMSGLDLKEVIIAIAGSDTFRNRTLVTPGEACK